MLAYPADNRAMTVEHVDKLHLADGYKSPKLSHLPPVLCVAKFLKQPTLHFLGIRHGIDR